MTTSPHFAQANGEAERGVQLAKKILAQDDPFIALLTYRATPTSPTGKSPAELLYGRRLRTTLPTIPANLAPHDDIPSSVRTRDVQHKKKNKKNFDSHHGVHELPELKPGDRVLQKLDHEKKWSNPATVQAKYAPRSYIILTAKGQVFRRNRRHLRLSRDFDTKSESCASDSRAGQRPESCSFPTPTPENPKNFLPTQFQVSTQIPAQFPVGFPPSSSLEEDQKRIQTSGVPSQKGTTLQGDASHSKPGVNGGSSVAVRRSPARCPPAGTSGAKGNSHSSASSRSGGTGVRSHANSNASADSSGDNRGSPPSPPSPGASGDSGSGPPRATRSGRAIVRPTRYSD